MVTVVLILTFFTGYGMTSQAIEIKAPTYEKAMDICLLTGVNSQIEYTGGADIDFVCVRTE